MFLKFFPVSFFCSLGFVYIIFSLRSANMDFWMTNLVQKIRDSPIIYLAIPGSHDSGTTAITSSSEIAPDAAPLIKDLSFLGPLLRDVLAKWSLTQPYFIKQQLYSGIRYFDLRIATKNNSDGFYFVHNLYSQEVNGDFQEISNFLDGHPKEVVILDCQHFHAMQDSDHKRFKQILVSTFGEKLQPYTEDVTSVTLSTMEKSKYQVIVVYREAPPNLENIFWPSDSLPNPWANTYTVPNLIEFLIENLKNRNNSLGYVSQCILTPNAMFIVEHVTSDLKNKCFVSLEEEKYKWLKNQRPGPGGVNIIISDFVDYNNNEFAKAVVALNEKLLKDNRS